MSTVTNEKLTREHKRVVRNLKRVEEQAAALEATSGYSLKIDIAGRSLMKAEENLRKAKDEVKVSEKNFKEAEKNLSKASVRVARGDAAQDHESKATKLKNIAEDKLNKAHKNHKAAIKDLQAAQESFKRSTVHDKFSILETQRNTLLAEKSRLVAAHAHRKNLDRFEILETSENTSAQSNAKIHESALTPERIVTSEAVDNLSRKGYIKLQSFNVADIEANTEDVQKAREEARWSITAKLPGSINSLYIITPVDTTPAAKISFGEGFELEAKARKERAAKRKENRRGMKSDFTEFNEGRKEKKAKRAAALANGVSPISYLMYGEQAVEYAKK